VFLGRVFLGRGGFDLVQLVLQSLFHLLLCLFNVFKLLRGFLGHFRRLGLLGGSRMRGIPSFDRTESNLRCGQVVIGALHLSSNASFLGVDKLASGLGLGTLHSGLGRRSVLLGRFMLLVRVMLLVRRRVMLLDLFQLGWRTRVLRIPHPNGGSGGFTASYAFVSILTSFQSHVAIALTTDELSFLGLSELSLQSRSRRSPMLPRLRGSLMFDRSRRVRLLVLPPSFRNSMDFGAEAAERSD